MFNAREQEEAIITILVGASPMSLWRRRLRLMGFVNHPRAGLSQKYMLFFAWGKVSLCPELSCSMMDAFLSFYDIRHISSEYTHLPALVVFF